MHVRYSSFHVIVGKSVKARPLTPSSRATGSHRTHSAAYKRLFPPPQNSPTPNSHHTGSRLNREGLSAWTIARSKTSHVLCGDFEWKLSLTLTLARANNEILTGLRLVLSLACSIQLNSIYRALSPRPLFTYSIAKASSGITIEKKIFIKSWFEMEIFSCGVFHYVIASAFLLLLNNEPSLSRRANTGGFEFIRRDSHFIRSVPLKSMWLTVTMETITR